MRDLRFMGAAKTMLALVLVLSLCSSGTVLGAYADDAAPSLPVEQLEETVPLEVEEVEQLVDQVPLVPEQQEASASSEEQPVAEKAAAAEGSVIITLSLSSEPTASWVDGTTEDKVIELRRGEASGGVLPEAPASSDGSLEFEGWQTEDFAKTYSQDELATEAFESDLALYAVFRAVVPDSGQTRAASGTSGSCTWAIDNNGKLTIQPTSGSSGTLGQAKSTMPCFPWQEQGRSATITSVQVKSGVVANPDSWSLFRGLNKATSFDLSGLNTANVTNMANFFNGCSSLTSLNLGSFNTAKVASMEYMFNGCSSLTSLNLGSFNTAKVTNMQHMFYNCTSLTSLNLSSFNTANVTNMQHMFYMYNKCSLKSLDLSSFRTSKVQNMKFMFRGCSSLTSLNISSFDTSNVTDMLCMFEGCSSLTGLDVSKFNTAKVTNMGHMFDGCSSLKSLNLSSFNTANVTDMGYMFQNCRSLTSLNVSSFRTPKVTTMGWMFYNCYALPSINVSNFDTSKVTNMHSMFCGCLALTELNISNFKTSSATDMAFLVAYDPVLSKVTFPSTFSVPVNASIFQMFYNSPKITEIPASFNFGTTLSSSTSEMFKVLSGNPVVTTYNGSDQKVKNYDWPADNRALKGLALTGSVSISGDSSVSGKTLTASASFGNPCRNAKAQYQWYRATNSAGSSAQAIAGATSSTYATTSADAGKYIVCKITDGLGAYTGTLSSTGVGPVKNAFTATVGVSGDKRTGATLTATVSDKNSGSEALSFQWYRSATPSGTGSAIPGAASNTYVQAAADRGMHLSCEVKVANASAWTGSVRSAWHGPSLTAFTATVGVSGDKRTGATLTAAVSNHNSGSEALSYQWYRSATPSGTGSAIPGAASNTYVQAAADRGMHLSCEVKVANASAWTGSVRSAWHGPSLTAFSATVQVTGEKRTGATLTAAVSDKNSGSEALSYQWYRSATPSGTGSAISGATSATYVQAAADRGMHLSCEVKVANASAWTGSVRSSWHGPSLTAFTAAVNVTGEAVVGRTLTASVPSHNAQGETLSYQWQRSSGSSWTNIDAANGTTYTLVDADLRANVRCVVSAPPERFAGSAASSAVGPVKGLMAGSATLSGHLFANQTLTATAAGLPSGATASYRWYACDTPAGAGKTAISQASASRTIDLSLVEASKIVGKRVFCEVSDSSGVFLGTIATPVSAQVGIAWGTMGPSVGGCTWSIDASGALVVEPASAGIGQLGEVAWNAVPWVPWAPQIQSARFASSVKSGASLRGLFAGCTALKTIDFAGFDASSAKDLASLFARCESLTEVKGLGGAFASAKPTTHAGMFSDCGNLAALDVAALDTSASLDMSDMFAGCLRLGSLTGMERLRSASGANLSGMFKGCAALQSANLAGMAGGDPGDLSSLFEGCASLASVELPAGLVGSKCATVERMFHGCNVLKAIPGSFSFGPNAGIRTTDCFQNTSGATLATTYLGDDQKVATYDWAGDSRSLEAWKLAGSVAIDRGDDPCADVPLAAKAAFAGPSADLAATYRWCTAASPDDPNPQPIEGATAAVYAPKAADLGKYLVCFAAAPKGSGAQGEIRAATSAPVRAPQICLSIPQETQVYVDSIGRVSTPDAHAYALGSTGESGVASEGDIALVGVTLTLGDGAYPGGAWTLGTPAAEGKPSRVFVEAQPFKLPGTVCAVEGAPALEPGASLPLQWVASFKNDIGPKLATLLAAAEGEGVRYGSVEFKVAWRPRA